MLTRSLSSWRAWIEIITPENVSRGDLGRSPHGERGLKLLCAGMRVAGRVVALLMESVD